jgi:hypothetical protein
MKYIDVSTENHPNTFATVDDGDYERTNAHKWTAVKYPRSNTLYAVKGSRGNCERMHIFILKYQSGELVDHRDGDGLNNQRSNLRKCTHAQNMQNRIVRQSNNTSGFKGVTWDKGHNKWRSMINKDNKRSHLGYFTCLIKAAKAYDRAAKELHGEFARTNF